MSWALMFMREFLIYLIMVFVDAITNLSPISLCKVGYKLASKTIANRKPFLDLLISSLQPAFVLGRLITENVLLAYKLNHFQAHRHWGTASDIPLKFDISNAYDRAEWSFLESVLTRISLHPKIVSLIMLCVNSITYSFLLNDAQCGYLHLEVLGKVTLYPLIFNALIHRVEGDSQGQGVAVSRLAPQVSHLLFVDDTLIFCQVTKETMRLCNMF
ncbi:UNVERIFIED_CONTAM: hypothetical protein Sangu_2040600 [Sesamum angustifolium]|uniref:Reverse transcriptase domain-containing protein n=1 Tax=Sesamum angustifolium TaxID=2727405 RepID=A0AAW2LI64_9LAMI